MVWHPLQSFPHLPPRRSDLFGQSMSIMESTFCGSSRCDALHCDNDESFTRNRNHMTWLDIHVGPTVMYAEHTFLMLCYRFWLGLVMVFMYNLRVFSVSVCSSVFYEYTYSESRDNKQMPMLFFRCSSSFLYWTVRHFFRLMDDGSKLHLGLLATALTKIIKLFCFNDSSFYF